MKHNQNRIRIVVDDPREDNPRSLSIGDAAALFNTLDELQPDPLENLSKLEEIADSTQAGLLAALALRRLSVDADASVRVTAATALGAIGDALARIPSLSRDEPRKDFKLGRGIDDRLERASRCLGFFANADLSMRRTWTAIGLVLTLGGCLALVQGRVALALGVIALRLTISLGLGSQHNLPFEGAHRRGESGLAVVVRCVAGHAADVLMLLAVGWVLLEAHRPLWALACLAASNLMLLATLARVASLQVGQQLFRLQLERVMRNAPLVLGLVAAIVLQPKVPEQGVPIVALTAFGSLAFACIELARVFRRLRDEPQDGRGANRVLMTVLGSRGPRVLSMGPVVQDTARRVPHLPLAKASGDIWSLPRRH